MSKLKNAQSIIGISPVTDPYLRNHLQGGGAHTSGVATTANYLMTHRSFLMVRKLAAATFFSEELNLDYDTTNMGNVFGSNKRNNIIWVKTDPEFTQLCFRQAAMMKSGVQLLPYFPLCVKERKIALTRAIMGFRRTGRELKILHGAEDIQLVKRVGGSHINLPTPDNIQLPPF